MEKKKKKTKKKVRVILLYGTLLSPSYLIIKHSCRRCTYMIYDTIEEIVEDYPLCEYTLCIDEVQTCSDIDQLVELW